MGYKTRLSLALVLGLVAGFGLGHFLGNQLSWIFISLAVAIAAETGLRTRYNIKSQPKAIKNLLSDNDSKGSNIRLKPPPEPNF